jgi:hypothetical protein
LTALIAQSATILEECSEASVLSPRRYLKLASSIIANETAATAALATYGDVDLITLDQDELDDMAAQRAAVVAGMHNKTSGSDFYNAIENEEEATLACAFKFVSVVKSVSLLIKKPQLQ